MDDIKIAVKNLGPIEVQYDRETGEGGLFYDGKPYSYPIGEPVIVPLEVASHHFGVEVTDKGKIVRDKKRQGSLYHKRLSSYSPLSLGLPHSLKNREDILAEKEEKQKFVQWFDSGISLKLVQSKRNLTEAEFDKL